MSVEDDVRAIRAMIADLASRVVALEEAVFGEDDEDYRPIETIAVVAQDQGVPL